MYIKNVDGYSGDGQFLAKFGIEVRHQITFTVAIRTWSKTTQALTGFAQPFVRPLEGDLIYFAMDNKILQIKHVDQYGIFYQTGALQSYDLTCEVFEYSSEIFNTGIAAVDTLSNHYSVSTSEQGSVVDGIPVFNPAFDLNNPYIGPSADNTEIETAGDLLVDFSADNPFSLKF
jgi:hypothetical protein